MLADGWEVEATSEDIVGAHEDSVYLQGRFTVPEPEVGLNYWRFEVDDVVNEEGISVLHLIEDEEWLNTAAQYVADNFNPTMQ